MPAARCARVRPAEATEAASPERRIDSAPRRRAQCHAVRALRISSAHRAVLWRWLRSDPLIYAGRAGSEMRVSCIEPRATLTQLNRRRTASRDAIARSFAVVHKLGEQQPGENLRGIVAQRLTPDPQRQRVQGQHRSVDRVRAFVRVAVEFDTHAPSGWRCSMDLNRVIGNAPGDCSSPPYILLDVCNDRPEDSDRSD